MNRRLILFALVMGFTLSACVTPEAIAPYESDALLSIRHNTKTAYTLLVYQTPLGYQRHVLRHDGVCEVVLTYEQPGVVHLKERGQAERQLTRSEVTQLQNRINALLDAKEQEEERDKRVAVRATT